MSFLLKGGFHGNPGTSLDPPLVIVQSTMSKPRGVIGVILNGNSKLDIIILGNHMLLSAIREYLHEQQL